MAKAGVADATRRRRVNHVLSIPEGFKTVHTPIPAVRRNRGGGPYAQALRLTLELEPTNEKRGLAPHKQWPCNTFEELKVVYSGIMAARRRLIAQGQKQFEKILTIRQSNPEEGRFVVYLWHNLPERGKQNT